MHALSTKVTADMAEPIKARATRKHERSPQGDLASLLAARRAAALGGRAVISRNDLNDAYLCVHALV